MKKVKRKDDGLNHVFILVVIAIVFFAVGVIVGNFIKVEETTETGNGKTEIIMPRDLIPDITNHLGKASIKIPAVDQEGNGVVTNLDVTIVEGSGKILTNIDKLFFFIDTQNSIRSARNVAQNVTGKDLSKYDIIYTVEAQASVIEGGSAGAALTIVTISALENLTLRNDVMITGTINDDGTIGPVGEVLAKAVAAKTVNATLFLVPKMQSSWRTYKSERRCEKIGPTEICTIETIPQKVTIGDQVGLEVKEVTNIREALNYFTGVQV